MFPSIDYITGLASDLVATAAEAGAPDIIVYNDLDHSCIKVAHVYDLFPYIVGDYPSLEEATACFPADFELLTAGPFDQRPNAQWYTSAVLALMDLDIAHHFKSKIVRGKARGSIYTLVYIDNVWRLSTATGIWVKTISSLI